MAAEEKPPAVWVHHAASGRTQRVSSAAWEAGELAADGWQLASDDQVAVAAPPPDPPPADGVAEQRRTRRR